jgi:rhodanese-related sulfurtransferase
LASGYVVLVWCRVFCSWGWPLTVPLPSATSGSLTLCLSLLSLLFSQWGLTGVCPGPLILGAVADFNTLASTTITGGPLLMLCFVFLGTAAAQQVSKTMCPAVKPVANASVETMANAILDSNAIVLDVRSADEREVSHAAPFEGMYECYEGKDTANMVYFLVWWRCWFSYLWSRLFLLGCTFRFGSLTFESYLLSFSSASQGTLSTPLDRSDPANFTIPVKCLPSDTTVPLIVHCRSGGRARMAKQKVAALQQYTTVHCCGLEEMNLLSNKISKIIKCTTNLTLKDSGIFLQFQDPTSSTYTYLIGDKKSKECILIDPVLERLEHDLARIAALGLTLVYGINTHCHADHVTSTGQMKLQVPSVRGHFCVTTRRRLEYIF